MTRDRKVFLYTFVIGILTHAFRMTNTMICSDSTNYFSTISASWVTTLGRFLLPGVEVFRGKVELTWLIGVISLIIIGLSAVLFVRLFDIRDNVGLVIAAWIFSANPVVTSIFAYMYTADGYMIALLFSVLAAYLCIRRNGAAGIIFAALSLAVSLGFYQAFISVTIVIMMFWLFRMLYSQEKSMKEIGQMAGRCLLTGIVGVVIYIICLTIVWRSGDYSISGYMGMDDAGIHGFQSILYAVKECYIDFARFYLVRWKWDIYNVMNLLMFLLTGIVWLFMIIKKQIWKNPSRVILMGVLVLLLPLACHIFEFASDGVSYTSTSMEYSLALPYLLLIIMWRDRPSSYDIDVLENYWWLDKTFWKKYYMWILSMALLLCIGFHFTVIANRSYYNMENANTKVEMLVNRIVTRMEMLEGYQKDMQVAIYGSCYETPEYVPAAPVMSGIVSNIFLTQSNEYINFMNHYLSTEHGVAGYDRMKELAATEEFKEMEQWPSGNSVRIIDGTIVLYLSDTDIERYLEQ